MSYRVRKMRHLIFLVLLPFAVSLSADNPEPNNSTPREIQALLNWAVYLSRYDSPTLFPEVRFVPHEFMVNNACYGKECQVIGWYNDRDIIYIDIKLKRLKTLFSRSIVVHEMVHYLQHKSYEYDSTCDDTLRREAEAYEIQRRYFFAYGALAPIRQKVHNCTDSSLSVPPRRDNILSGTKEVF